MNSFLPYLYIVGACAVFLWLVVAVFQLVTNDRATINEAKAHWRFWWVPLIALALLWPVLRPVYSLKYMAWRLRTKLEDEPIAATDALMPLEFKWNGGEPPTHGFIAQEVDLNAPVMPRSPLTAEQIWERYDEFKPSDVSLQAWRAANSIVEDFSEGFFDHSTVAATARRIDYAIARTVKEAA